MSNDEKTKAEKIYETARVAFKRLNAAPGNIIVVTMPADINSSQMRKFADTLSGLAKEHQVSIIFLRAGQSVKELGETDMKHLGWIRDPNFVAPKETLN